MTSALRARQGRLKVRGGRIWYRVIGDRDAIPLVTVHGGPGATHDYLEPLQDLVDERPVVFMTSSAQADPTSPMTSSCGPTTGLSRSWPDSSTHSASPESTCSASPGAASSPPSMSSPARIAWPA